MHCLKSLSLERFNPELKPDETKTYAIVGRMHCLKSLSLERFNPEFKPDETKMYVIVGRMHCLKSLSLERFNPEFKPDETKTYVIVGRMYWLKSLPLERFKPGETGRNENVCMGARSPAVAGMPANWDWLDGHAGKLSQAGRWPCRQIFFTFFFLRILWSWSL